MIKTFFQKPANVKENWYVLDATDKVLGRIASKIAIILRGKLYATFTPHVMEKNYIIVINASKLKITGKKSQNKIYRYHTLYPGGLKEIPYYKMIQKDPTFPLKEAVYGMLPKNKSRKKIIGKLKIYMGPEHSYNNRKLEVIN